MRMRMRSTSDKSSSLSVTNINELQSVLSEALFHFTTIIHQEDDDVSGNYVLCILLAIKVLLFHLIIVGRTAIQQAEESWERKSMSECGRSAAFIVK